MSSMVRGYVLNLAKPDDLQAKMVGRSVDPEAIEEMDRELTRVIEDFDRAVNVEALRVAKDAGMPSQFQSDKNLF